jgi:hypothetical protein
MLEKKLTGAIHGIKTGSKTRTDAEVFLKQMEKINSGLAEDFKKKIDEAVIIASKKK